MDYHKYRVLLAKARELWESDRLVPGMVAARVVRGWASCRNGGVPRHGGAPVLVGAEQLRRRDDPRMRRVLAAVRAVFGDEPPGMVAVADSTALVLDRWGDSMVSRHAEKVGLVSGALWTCGIGGVNGIGFAAAHGWGGVMYSLEHWREEQFPLSCTVWPIRFRRRVFAVVNVTTFCQHVHDDTLRLLRLLAEGIERDLDAGGRHEVARMWAASGWRRGDGPALLIDQNGTVVSSREVPLRVGDRVTVRRDRVGPGPCWLPEFGYCVLEPLPGADGWLVCPIAAGEPPQIRATMDLSSPGGCVVSVRRTVDWQATVTEPQHVRILSLLARHRSAGLTATALAEELFGDSARRRHVHVLISRLRRQVGGLLTVDRRDGAYRFGENISLELRGTPRP